jgi:hypothetical protein
MPLKIEHFEKIKANFERGQKHPQKEAALYVRRIMP